MKSDNVILIDLETASVENSWKVGSSKITGLILRNSCEVIAANKEGMILLGAAGDKSNKTLQIPTESSNDVSSVGVDEELK